MLVPAVIYKEELTKKFNEIRYSDKAVWFNGCIESGPIQIQDAPSEGKFQYAIVDRKPEYDYEYTGGTVNKDGSTTQHYESKLVGYTDVVVGYLGFYVGWYDCGVWGIGLISFEDKPNQAITSAIREMIKMFKNYHLHRIEFRAIGGNPVVKKYDKIIATLNKGNRYSCKKITLTDTFKDRYGNFQNSYIYELIEMPNEVSITSWFA